MQPAVRTFRRIWAKQVQQGDHDQVRRRRVFYIPGFDPFPPRRYRELYRKEGAEQARLSGHILTLTPSPKGEPFGWTVDAEIEGAKVETRFEVLIWHDLVKAAMAEGILASYSQLIRTAWTYVRSGAVGPLMGLRKGPMLAAFYPVAALLGQLVLGLLLAWALWRGLSPWLGAWALLPAGFALWGVLHLSQKIDHRIFAHYLMHDFAYVARHGGAYDPALEARLQDFATRLRAALAEEVEEVLVVGHSSGVHLGVSVLADLVRQGLPEGGPRLSFLSLGQAVPMVSFLPKATRLRADLQLMGGQDRIAWVDVSAPGDGCTFALCDPVAVTGVAPAPQKAPLILSAAFKQTLSPQKLKSLRRRYFRLHFQYLCAFDNLPSDPSAYEYFATTAGPQTLWHRFGGRKPSNSRITRAASPYRSVS